MTQRSDEYYVSNFDIENILSAFERNMRRKGAGKSMIILVFISLALELFSEKLPTFLT